MRRSQNLRSRSTATIVHRRNAPQKHRRDFHRNRRAAAPVIGRVLLRERRGPENVVRRHDQLTAAVIPRRQTDTAVRRRDRIRTARIQLGQARRQEKLSDLIRASRNRKRHDARRASSRCTTRDRCFNFDGLYAEMNVSTSGKPVSPAPINVAVSGRDIVTP